ncbi:hypothetical protein N2W54_001765 [Lotmaria passim]
MNQSGNVRSGSFSHSGEEESTAPVLQAPVPLSVGTELGPSHPMTMAMRRSSLVIEGDGVTRALLRPFIPHALDVALHVAFDYQSITLGMTYDSVRVLVYYFYSSYKILFRPLAAPERHNIYRRLVTAFGVPQQGILEHLAARCAIRCLQQSAKSSPHPAHDAESMNQSGNVRSGSFSHSGEEESTAPVLQAPVPLSVGTELGPSHPMTMAMRRSSLVIEGDGVTRALLRPFIPHALDVALHVAFDYQSITLGMTYDSVRVLVYYFYSSYKILFRPLAAPERHNIYRRLVTAFGVPQQGILEHLAARCAIRCLQQSAKPRERTSPQHQEEVGVTLTVSTALPGTTGR